MQAGNLTDMIQILRVQVEINEFGEQFDTYIPCCTTSAHVEPVGAGRSDVNSEIFYNHTYRFTMRTYVKVDDFDRIMWKGKQYQISSIDDDKRLDTKTVIATLINL